MFASAEPLIERQPVAHITPDLFAPLTVRDLSLCRWVHRIWTHHKGSDLDRRGFYMPPADGQRGSLLGNREVHSTPNHPDEWSCGYDGAHLPAHFSPARWLALQRQAFEGQIQVDGVLPVFTSVSEMTKRGLKEGRCPNELTRRTIEFENATGFPYSDCNIALFAALDIGIDPSHVFRIGVEPRCGSPHGAKIPSGD